MQTYQNMAPFWFNFKDKTHQQQLPLKLADFILLNSTDSMHLLF